MIRKRFLTHRPQALAQRAEQIRRVQQIRRMLAELDMPHCHESDLFGDEGDYDRLRSLH